LEKLKEKLAEISDEEETNKKKSNRNFFEIQNIQKQKMNKQKSFQ